jgi:hypothetical protein
MKASTTIKGERVNVSEIANAIIATETVSNKCKFYGREGIVEMLSMGKLKENHFSFLFSCFGLREPLTASYSEKVAALDTAARAYIEKNKTKK